MNVFFKKLIINNSNLIKQIRITMQKPQIYTIDGNIGSGKSTLLEKIKEHYKHHPNIVFAPEPVDEWESIKDANGISMLEKFYKDQKAYSFPFQMMAYISRLHILKQIIKKNPNAVIITERSLYTDQMVFAKMLFDSGLIEDVNYQIYLKWFDTFAEEYPISGAIYVNTDPQVCFERIKRRSRTGESDIPLDYLVKCDKYHNDMIEVFKKKITIIELDGNKDIFDESSILNLWIHRIEQFINDDK
jgi:deoxyadenosine/deoxycytidine kinase